MLLGQFLLALSTRSVCCLLVLIDEFVVVVHLCTSVHGSLDALRCEVGRDSASQERSRLGQNSSRRLT